jgi:single-strand DNA-binding protein
MARGINKVIIVGNLGHTPEIVELSAGVIKAKIRVATDSSYKDKQTQQLVTRTEWHPIALFNRKAEFARDHLQKGSKVFIEGRLETRKWQDKSGQDRYTTEIIAHELLLLDKKIDTDQANAPHHSAVMDELDDFDDMDIPF